MDEFMLNSVTPKFCGGWRGLPKATPIQELSDLVAECEPLYRDEALELGGRSVRSVRSGFRLELTELLPKTKGFFGS